MKRERERERTPLCIVDNFDCIITVYIFRTTLNQTLFALHQSAATADGSTVVASSSQESETGGGGASCMGEEEGRFVFKGLVCQIVK